MHGISRGKYSLSPSRLQFGFKNALLVISGATLDRHLYILIIYNIKYKSERAWAEKKFSIYIAAAITGTTSVDNRMAVIDIRARCRLAGQWTRLHFWKDKIIFLDKYTLNVLFNEVYTSSMFNEFKFPKLIMYNNFLTIYWYIYHIWYRIMFLNTC